MNSIKNIIPTDMQILKKNRSRFPAPAGTVPPITVKPTNEIGIPLNSRKNTNSPTLFANKVKNKDTGLRSSIPIFPF